MCPPPRRSLWPLKVLVILLGALNAFLISDTVLGGERTQNILVEFRRTLPLGRNSSRGAAPFLAPVPMRQLAGDKRCFSCEPERPRIRPMIASLNEPTRSRTEAVMISYGEPAIE